MMITRCRFDGSAPTREQLDAEFTRQLGRGGPAMMRDLERHGEHIIELLSMDAVALVYGRRALVALGGTPIDILSGEPHTVLWPAWSERPWTSYGALQKLRIWLGAVRL